MIIIDDETFDIEIASVTRAAEFLDKHASRTNSGKLERELIGVFFNYKLKFAMTTDLTEYAALWEKLTEPKEFHTVTVPDEDGDYTFTAYFSKVGDKLVKSLDSGNYWKDLTVNFIAKRPARK